MKMTSAQANKYIKQLEDELALVRENERKNKTYIVVSGEEEIIPEYDYTETTSRINKLNDIIMKIRHAINVNNTNTEIDVDGKKMSIDTILIRMAQMTRRKNMLDTMRKTEPKTRRRHYDGKGGCVYEYECVNYKLIDVKDDYKKIFNEITKMQLALDHYNHTFEFEVEIKKEDLEVDM